MKRISILIVSLFFLAVLACYSPTQHSEGPNDALDKKVDALIAKMTLEEKVGQMTEVTLDVVTKSNASPHQLDADKLKDAIMKYHVGSILNVSGPAYDRNHWHDVISTIPAGRRRRQAKDPRNLWH